MLKGVGVEGSRKPSSLSAIHIKDVVKVRRITTRYIYVNVHYGV